MDPRGNRTALWLDNPHVPGSKNGVKFPLRNIYSDPNARRFVSTDDRLVRKLKGRDDIRCLLPGDALALMEDWYED